MKFPIIYLLNENYEVIASFSNEIPNALPVVSDFYNGDIDSNDFTVEMTTILTHPRASEIKIGRYIYYPTNDSGDKKIFRIIETKEERAEVYTMSLKAELTATGDLLEQIVKPREFSSESVEEIMKSFLMNTQWNVELKGTFPSVDYEITEYTTSLEAIRSFAEYIGANIDYEYTFEGLKLVNRKVILFKENSEDVVLYISKERDLQSITRTINNSNVITSLIGIGGETEDGEKITLALLKEITEIPEGFSHEYGSDYIDHVESVQKSPTKRYGILSDGDCKTPQQLLEKCTAKLKELCKPEVKYEVNFAVFDHVDRLALGKKIFINDTTVEPKIALSGNIRQIKTSIYNSSENSVTLGNYVAYNTELDDAIKDIQDRLEKEEAQSNKNSYTMKIDSTTGTSFVNGEGETTLTIRVYKNGRELDTDGLSYEYIWQRYSNTGEIIPITGIEGTTKELKQKSVTILGKYVAKDNNKITLKGTANIVL